MSKNILVFHKNSCETKHFSAFYQIIRLNYFYRLRIYQQILHNINFGFRLEMKWGFVASSYLYSSCPIFSSMQQHLTDLKKMQKFTVLPDNSVLFFLFFFLHTPPLFQHPCYSSLNKHHDKMAFIPRSEEFLLIDKIICKYT